MHLSNRLYDVLKWLVLIGLPALAVLVKGLGDIYGWFQAEQMVALTNLIAMFIGSLIQLSSHHYHQGGSGPDVVHRAIA
ncbi:phage holin [Aerococcaceae bacterium zg-ZUI334]|uniref:phage holin n=1 Tax=Aerococcaceae TaxID=186827 RepID=UPI0013BD1BEA|nr:MULTISPECIES: phage holin [unclassified Facklamia]MBR7928325.1 phage holin [Aerococcaceae bacterium zg-ZUI334]NEW65378.1 holin [Facklamia sp. 252]NEW68530.1 holin [Facklamia sp. 253]QQD64903.1 phage holin [Aerococcaceae bacterium zg-252]